MFVQGSRQVLSYGFRGPIIVAHDEVKRNVVAQSDG